MTKARYRFGVASFSAKNLQRLWKNSGRYLGDCIDIRAVLSEVRTLATETGWHIDVLETVHGLEVLALRRHVARPRYTIYISAGIHGDEPAGPLAARELLRDNAWPDCADILLCPCLNPGAFPLNTRECVHGMDLNRDYRHLRSAEVRAHIHWLKQQPSFDLSLCLHEDWEAHGFYLYELNPQNQPSLSEHMINSVRTVCPIDYSTMIDGREARDGIILPAIDPSTRPEWPEAFYLITHKTQLSYTLEAPSDFPLDVRVNALATATKAAVQKSCSQLLSAAEGQPSI